MRTWRPYLLLAPVLAAALFLGARTEEGPPTPAARTSRIAQEVRCPTCEGLSAAESDAPASLAIRQEIRRRVEAGETDAEIRSYLVSRYGRDVLLKPEATGVASLVWLLPVAAGICAVAGLGLAFRRWRATPWREASPEDRLLVDQARQR
ncbi:MAG: cytochrome c-type biogenesis protein CcmH [Actinomycetota bacterium]|nr:cytochrome c-type biogenesis protein CcmH [Actinomycetota bacterium]